MEIFTSHMPIVFKMIMLIEERANQRIYLKYPDFFIVCLIYLEFSWPSTSMERVVNPKHINYRRCLSNYMAVLRDFS